MCRYILFFRKQCSWHWLHKQHGSHIRLCELEQRIKSLGRHVGAGSRPLSCRRPVWRCQPWVERRRRRQHCFACYAERCLLWLGCHRLAAADRRPPSCARAAVWTPWMQTTSLTITEINSDDENITADCGKQFKTPTDRPCVRGDDSWWS